MRILNLNHSVAMDMIRRFFMVFVFLPLVFCYLCFQTNPVLGDDDTDSIGFNCSSFPDDFVFGSSSAAYQYEGAVSEGGRGPSVWDTFIHKYPAKIVDGSNGDVAEDFYHRYKEDVQLMKFIGFGGFRLSISWSRVLPSGKLSGGVNKEGVAFYNNLIDELLANDVQPFVTIFHWDTPQALQDEYGGFVSSRIVDDFRDFAELCFKEFGDRVKYWFTMNEPYVYILGGYDLGVMAPGRCSAWMPSNCPGGNSATEPYLVGHHMLLAHAAAAKVYKAKYQASQKGQIGITTVSHWFVPLTNSTADKKAAKRSLDFMYGWFIHPLTYGDYPKTMRSLVGKRLPKFTVEETKLLKESLDFIGLNYFTSVYASDAASVNSTWVSSSLDPHANMLFERNGIPIGPPTAYFNFFDTPKGFKDLLIYTKREYKNLSIYITENGMADSGDLTVEHGVNDTCRIKFFRGHFLALKEAIEAGVKVKGHFAWSLLDTFEWSSGYSIRFGLTYVDYKDGLKRYIKSSGMWYKKLLSQCKKKVSEIYSL